MKLVVILLGLVDPGLGVLLVLLSGMILQGVNHTGPMDGAWLMVPAMVLCLAAPPAAWLFWQRLGPPGALLLVATPLVLAFPGLAGGG